MGHSDISITAKIYVHNDVDVLQNKCCLMESNFLFFGTSVALAFWHKNTLSVKPTNNVFM